jgi:hypothetical protein
VGVDAAVRAEETTGGEPHYNGFPAVPVRPAAIDVSELTELITDAWRCQAPRALLPRPPGA